MIGALKGDQLRPTDSAVGENVPVNVDALLQSILGRKAEQFGLAAAALRGTRVIAQGAAGVRKRGAAERITLDDRFFLASSTKAMAATLVAVFVDEGRLNWTTSLGELFGGTIKTMHSAWEKVTVRQVLAHRAGLRLDPDGPGRVFALLRAPYASLHKGPDLMWPPRARVGTLPQQRLEIARQALSRPPCILPDTKYWYSNEGYVVAGAILEQLTGRSWEDLMRERLFQPLGIRTGGFGQPGTAGKIDQPWGHSSYAGKPIDPGRAAAQFPLYYGPAATAHMTIGDWAKFVGLHLRGDRGNPNCQAALLKPETFAELHAATPGTPYSKGWAMRGITLLAALEAGPAVAYRAGWFIGTSSWAKGTQPENTGRHLWHGGSNGITHTVMCIAPEIDFAVLIACNRGLDTAILKTRQVIKELIREFARA